MISNLLKIIIISILFNFNLLYGKDNTNNNYKQNYSGVGYELSIIFGSLKDNQLNGMLIFKFNKNKFLKMKDAKDIDLLLVKDSNKIVLNNSILIPAVKKHIMKNQSALFGIQDVAKIPFIIDIPEKDSQFMKLIGQLQFYICSVDSECRLEKIKLKNIIIATEIKKILVDEKIQNEIKRLPLNVSADLFKANTKIDINKKKITLTINDDKIKEVKYAIFSSEDFEFMEDVIIYKNNNSFIIESNIKNFINENENKNENKNENNIKINIDTNIGNFILSDTILQKENKITNVRNNINTIYEDGVKDSKFKQIILLIILCFSPVMLMIYYNRISFLNKVSKESFYLNEIIYFSGIIFAITVSQILIINYFSNFIFFMYYLINQFNYVIITFAILIILHSILLKQINEFLHNTNYLKYLVSFLYGFVSFFGIFFVIIILLQNTFHYVSVDYNLGLLQITMILLIIASPYFLFYMLKEKIKDIIDNKELNIFKIFMFYFSYIILIFMIFMLMIGSIYYFMVLLFLAVFSVIIFLLKYKIKDAYYKKILIMIIFLTLLIVSFFEKNFVQVDYRVSETGLIWNRIKNINDISNRIKDEDGLIVVKVTADWCLKCYLVNQIFRDKELNSIIKNDAAILFEYNITKEFDINFMSEIKKYNKFGILPFLMVIKKDKTIIFYDSYFKNNLINFLKK